MRWLFATLFCLCHIAANSPLCTATPFPYDSDELDSGYITVFDEPGAIVLQTGLTMTPGDQYISEDNRLYEIIAVEGSLARSRFIRAETAIAIDTAIAPVQAPAETKPPLIAIYHTHTDESYIPTDGKAAEQGNGSVMLVGSALSARLAELGYAVDHDQTLHDPHDANAYQRSRRTFMKLLEKQPAALFDIHRDSAPLNIYRATIQGESAAKILLVVGRQNQNRATTLDFAKRIKAAADAKYKGLIRGIIIAHGNYNQDLSPRAMLIEVGTQYNSRETADHSAVLFADIIPSLLTYGLGQGGNTASAEAQADVTGQATADPYRNDIFFILGAAIIGIIGYLYLSTGSWREARHKVTRFVKYEFNDLFRSRRKKN